MPSDPEAAKLFWIRSDDASWWVQRSTFTLAIIMARRVSSAFVKMLVIFPLFALVLRTSGEVYKLKVIIDWDRIVSRDHKLLFLTSVSVRIAIRSRSSKSKNVRVSLITVIVTTNISTWDANRTLKLYRIVQHEVKLPIEGVEAYLRMWKTFATPLDSVPLLQSRYFVQFDRTAALSLVEVGLQWTIFRVNLPLFRNARKSLTCLCCSAVNDLVSYKSQWQEKSTLEGTTDISILSRISIRGRHDRARWKMLLWVYWNGSLILSFPLSIPEKGVS